MSTNRYLGSDEGAGAGRAGAAARYPRALHPTLPESHTLTLKRTLPLALLGMVSSSLPLSEKETPLPLTLNRKLRFRRTLIGGNVSGTRTLATPPHLIWIASLSRLICLPRRATLNVILAPWRVLPE